MVQDIPGKGLRGLVGHIFLQPFRVQAGLVHAKQADGGEMVLKGTQVPFGIGVKAPVQQFGDDGAFDFSGSGRRDPSDDPAGR